jgi:hypothetical protein
MEQPENKNKDLPVIAKILFVLAGMAMIYIFVSGAVDVLKTGGFLGFMVLALIVYFLWDTHRK